MLLAAAQPRDSETIRLLVHGAIGAPTGHEFLTWLDSLDLPDPESLLADPGGDLLRGLRPDRVHVALQGVLASVSTRTTVERWESGVGVCVRAAELSGVDPAVPVVRSLMRIRPPRATLPGGLSVFAGPLALAGLLAS